MARSAEDFACAVPEEVGSCIVPRDDAEVRPDRHHGVRRASEHVEKLDERSLDSWFDRGNSGHICHRLYVLTETCVKERSRASLRTLSSQDGEDATGGEDLAHLLGKGIALKFGSGVEIAYPSRRDVYLDLLAVLECVVDAGTHDHG